jgi:hypothetical protein
MIVMATLSADMVKKAKRQIVKQFPEFSDVEPEIVTREVQAQRALAEKLGVPLSDLRAQTVHTLVFRKRITADDGTEWMQSVRATLDEEGKVAHLTTRHAG